MCVVFRRRPGEGPIGLSKTGSIDRRDEGAKAQAGIDSLGVSRDRCLAVSFQRDENPALRRDARGRIRIVHRRKERARGLVVHAAFDAERPLPYRRQATAPAPASPSRAPRARGARAPRARGRSRRTRRRRPCAGACRRSRESARSRDRAGLASEPPFAASCSSPPSLPAEAPRASRARARRARRVGRREAERRRERGPGGGAPGTSLIEWTAKSARPARSASSISLTKSPLPPTSESGRS